MVEAADICGVAAAAAGFACSTGEGLFMTRRRRGEVRLPGLAFDNHLMRI